MEHCSIKRKLNNKIEYYGTDCGWTTDKNLAEFYTSIMIAKDIIKIYELVGAYISVEDVQAAKCTSIAPSGTLKARADLAILELNRVLAEFQAVTDELQREINEKDKQ